MWPAQGHSEAHLGAVHLPIVVLPAHAEDLAGLQAAHKVRLAVLLHERRGLLGRHLVLAPGLRGRAAGRHWPQAEGPTQLPPSSPASEGGQTLAQGLRRPPAQPTVADASQDKNSEGPGSVPSSLTTRLCDEKGTSHCPFPASAFSSVQWVEVDGPKTLPALPDHLA